MSPFYPPWGPPRRLLAALAFALTFPTLMASLYFLVFAGEGGEPSPALQSLYSGGKLLQFLFPLLFVLVVTGQRPWRSGERPHLSALVWGFGFGVLVSAAMLALYAFALRDTPLLAQTPARVRHKLEEFGLATPAGYLGLTAFIVVVHSFLEEYYWRWFVYGGLRRLLAPGPAVALSSLGFMAHHVIVLYVYLPGHFLTAVVPFSLCIAVGGAVWAYLYERTGSLAAPWLSHLLVDAAIFAIGWDLIMKN